MMKPTVAKLVDHIKGLTYRRPYRYEGARSESPQRSVDKCGLGEDLERIAWPESAGQVCRAEGAA